MRLRGEFLRALRTAPIATMHDLLVYARARRNASQLLERLGLDEALAQLDGAPRSAHGTVSATLIMRLGESLPWTGRACLDRALTRYAFLKAMGSAPTFVIGLDPTLTAHHEPEALGHAWVEVEGEPWPHEDVTAYRVSFRHPAGRSLAQAPSVAPRLEIQ